MTWPCRDPQSMRDMFDLLCQHGCTDLSSKMDTTREDIVNMTGGGFGDIWKGELQDGTIIAIKTWRSSVIEQFDYKTLKRAAREVHFWSRMRHTNVHELMGVVIFKDRFIGMVSEWMENVESGLDYMHKIDALNVLVSSDGVAKLADFGLSTMAESSLEFSETSSSQAGSIRWAAPELLSTESPKSKQSDVYEIVTGSVPYAQCQRDFSVMKLVEQGVLPIRPTDRLQADEFGDRMWSLLVGCWGRNPDARPSAEQVVNSECHLRYSLTLILSMIVGRFYWVRSSHGDETHISRIALIVECQDTLIHEIEYYYQELYSDLFSFVVATGHSDQTLALCIVAHVVAQPCFYREPRDRPDVGSSLDLAFHLLPFLPHPLRGLVRTTTHEPSLAIGCPQSILAASWPRRSPPFPYAHYFTPGLLAPYYSPDGQKGIIYSVAFSPDGKSVVSSSSDKTICVWDADTVFPRDKLWKGHTSAVTSVSYSSLGDIVASGSWDSTVRLWDAITGREVDEPLKGPDADINSIAFSPSGNLLATGSDENTVRLWDLRNMSSVASSLKGHFYWITSVVFTPDEARIISGSYDKTIRIWDIERETTVIQLIGEHTQGVRSVDISPDGSQIISGSDETALRLWDSHTGAMIGNLFEGHTRWVSSVNFSPNGIYVASGSDDKTVRIWDVRMCRQVGEPFKEHTDTVTSVAFSPCGRLIASGSYDQTVKIRNIILGDFNLNSSNEFDTRHKDDCVHEVGVPEPISQYMSIQDMFSLLTKHGCTDLSSELDNSQGTAILVSGGGFGDIRKGKLRNGSMIAIKTWRASLIEQCDYKILKRATREIYYWSKMKHENIHELMGMVIFMGQSLGMVSEWMENGNLHEYLRRNPGADRYQLSMQVTSGLEYLHSYSMLNVLVSSNEVAKLTDFGLSAMSGTTIAFSETTNSQAVSTRWAAPELLLEGALKTEKSDVYALGMEIITGEVPYSQCQRDYQVITKVLQGTLPERPTEQLKEDSSGNQIWELLLKCWDRDPDARKSAKEVAEFLASVQTVKADWKQATMRNIGMVAMWNPKVAIKHNSQLHLHSRNFLKHNQATTGRVLTHPFIYVTIVDEQSGWNSTGPLRITHLLVTQSQCLKQALNPQRLTSLLFIVRTIFYPPNDDKLTGCVAGGHRYGVLLVAFSPDGNSVASGSRDQTVRIWDAHSKSLIGDPTEGHTDEVNSVSYSPHGDIIASGSDDNTIRLWNAKSGKQLGKPLKCTKERVWSTDFSPTGNLLACACDSSIGLWHIQHRNSGYNRFSRDCGIAYSVAFSPEGTHIASGWGDRAVRLMDLEWGLSFAQTLTGHEGWVRSVSFSPDGSQIVSGSDDSTLRFWDIRIGGMVNSLYEGHKDTVRSVIFSPDGNYVASASADRKVCVWDIRTGSLLAEPFKGHKSTVYSISFSPCGNCIASGSSDRKVIIWDVSSMDIDWETNSQVEEGQDGEQAEASALFEGDDINSISIGQYMSIQEIFDIICRHGCIDFSPYMDTAQDTAVLMSGGGFGDIWKGQLHDGSKVAIKAWRASLIEQCDYKTLKRATREIYYWSKMKHENIHELLGVIVFMGHSFGMVSEWMENGNLHEYLRKEPSADSYQLSTQIASGLAYVHSNDMLNVLISSNGTAKLTDFGLSTMAESSIGFSATTTAQAPELLLKETARSKMSDVYALGMEAFTGAVPYYPECSRDFQVLLAVQQGVLPTRPVSQLPNDSKGDQMWSLLETCWDREPDARPSAIEVAERVGLDLIDNIWDHYSTSTMNDEYYNYLECNPPKDAGRNRMADLTSGS
ncbi:Vegetative incompatibility protein [Rhizoctonia solani AG-1 IA]|uniref:Vegetative incompatibility protein n=1 Tax=Thanatephorus cucumeris (strain AG1-IA) TaxID=983506 RepID=L8WQ00_THACA|nr:Vegetative incompatibility protein [Rhizoctonia solani AG-1 IA]